MQHRRSASQDLSSQRDLSQQAAAGAVGGSRRGLAPTSTASGESKLSSKVKFLETHVAELTDTIKVCDDVEGRWAFGDEPGRRAPHQSFSRSFRHQRKNHLLQHYILRERRGALAPPQESTTKEVRECDA